MFQPFGHLQFGRALIGSTGLVDSLLRDEVVHVSVRQRDPVLARFAEVLFLGEGGWREFGEGVSESSNAAVREGPGDSRGTEWVVVSPCSF